MGMVVNPYRFGGGVVGTSYANTGGSGNRAGVVTVSATSITFTGSVAVLVDGAQGDSLFFNPNTVGSGVGFITFDFGTSKVIDALKWYQDITTNHGTWRFEGSPDNSAWTQVGSDFSLNGAVAGTEFLFTNTTGYRYYRIRHMSGTRSSNPWLREVQFKISA